MGRLPLLRRATRYTGAQKQTPLKEILQLMKKQNYKFPASIEYEYDAPEGSDVLTEPRNASGSTETLWHRIGTSEGMLG
jgi:hypothetical protein